jgi:lactoylglutathione lyase
LVKIEADMIPVRDLFESHLTVTDLQRSMNFFGQTLGLGIAEVFWDRRVAFYWIGGRGNSMLGLWEVGTGPQRLSLHVAPAGRSCASTRSRWWSTRLFGSATDEPVVLGWMPAASLYFRDPDGNMLEFISMLPDSPQPELGIVGWSHWKQIHESVRGPRS